MPDHPCPRCGWTNCACQVDDRPAPTVTRYTPPEYVPGEVIRDPAYLRAWLENEDCVYIGPNLWPCWMVRDRSAALLARLAARGRCRMALVRAK